MAQKQYFSWDKQSGVATIKFGPAIPKEKFVIDVEIVDHGFLGTIDWGNGPGNRGIPLGANYGQVKLTVRHRDNKETVLHQEIVTVADYCL